MPPFGLNSDELFTINKWYDGDLKTSFFYVVGCDDGFIRKVGTEYFITQEEYREIKLNELDISQL
jgi:hypothetical protein